MKAICFIFYPNKTSWKYAIELDSKPSILKDYPYFLIIFVLDSVPLLLPAELYTFCSNSSSFSSLNSSFGTFTNILSSCVSI